MQKQNDNNVIQSGVGNAKIDNLQKKPLENNANPATSITNQAIKQENKDNTQQQINKPLNNQINISQPTQIQKQPTQQNIQSQPTQQRPSTQPANNNHSKIYQSQTSNKTTIQPTLTQQNISRLNKTTNQPIKYKTTNTTKISTSNKTS